MPNEYEYDECIRCFESCTHGLPAWARGLLHHEEKQSRSSRHAAAAGAAAAADSVAERIRETSASSVSLRTRNCRGGGKDEDGVRYGLCACETRRNTGVQGYS